MASTQAEELPFNTEPSAYTTARDAVRDTVDGNSNMQGTTTATRNRQYQAYVADDIEHHDGSQTAAYISARDGNRNTGDNRHSNAPSQSQRGAITARENQPIHTHQPQIPPTMKYPEPTSPKTDEKAEKAEKKWSDRFAFWGECTEDCPANCGKATGECAGACYKCGIKCYEAPCQCAESFCEAFCGDCHEECMYRTLCCFMGSVKCAPYCACAAVVSAGVSTYVADSPQCMYPALCCAGTCACWGLVNRALGL